MPDEAIPESTPEPTPPPPPGGVARGGKKSKPGRNMRMALLEVIEKKRVGHEVGYTEIARRWGISNKSLRTRYSDYKNGLIDFGDDQQTRTEIAIDLEDLFRRTLDSSKRYHRILQGTFEGNLSRAEIELNEGKLDALERYGIHKTMLRLKELLHFRVICEKGFQSLLEEMVTSRQHAANRLKDGMGGETPKDMGEALVVEATRIVTASDEQEAAELLAAEREKW